MARSVVMIYRFAPFLVSTKNYQGLYQKFPDGIKLGLELYQKFPDGIKSGLGLYQKIPDGIKLGLGLYQKFPNGTKLGLRLYQKNLFGIEKGDFECCFSRIIILLQKD